MIKRLFLLVALCLCAGTSWAQALSNGFVPQQTSQTPLALRIGAGDNSSVLGTFQFPDTVRLLTPNATSYIYMDLTQNPPALTVNTTGFPTTPIYKIAIATTNSNTITSLQDVRPPFNTTAFANGGITGMTSGQLPLAASSTTIASSIPIQGTDGNILSSGTLSGLASLICTDANGGATTSGCPSGGGVTLQTNGSANGSNSTLNFVTSVTNSTGLTSTPFNINTNQEKLEVGGTLNIGSLTPGASSGDQITSGSGGVWQDTVPGININSITGTTYAVAAADRGFRDQFTGSSASAWTIAQAGTTGFANNFFFTISNISTNAVNITLTPTTSKINGATTLIIPEGQICYITSDVLNGANGEYWANCTLITISGGSLVSIAPNQFGGTVDLTGTVPITLGGTGQTTQQAGFNALAPTPTRAGDVIYYNGTNYTTLAGNNSGTNCFQENASGVPSFAACGSGGSALSSITAATASNTIANGNNPQIWNWGQTTAAQVGFTIGDSSAATGSNDVLMQVQTLTGSTEIPFSIVQNAGASGANTPTALAVTFGAGGAAANVTDAGHTGSGLNWTAGNGSPGGATSGTGGTGGTFSFTAGNGGNATPGSTNGSGGAVAFQAGAAGTGGTGGTPGNFTFTGAGAAGSDSNLIISNGTHSLTIEPDSSLPSQKLISTDVLTLAPANNKGLTVALSGTGVMTVSCGATAADNCHTINEGSAAPTGDASRILSSSSVELASFGPNGILGSASNQILASDYTNSTTTPSNIISYTLPPTVSAKTYFYNCEGMWESTNTSLVGLVLGINISAAPTGGIQAGAKIDNAAAGTNVTGYVNNSTTGNQTVAIGNAAGVTTTPYTFRIFGAIQGAATAGSTFSITGASTSGTTATVAVKAGFGCFISATQ